MSGVISSADTINTSGKRKLVAAVTEGCVKVKIWLSLAKAVTKPVLPLIVAPTHVLPLPTPISPLPAARTQFLLKSVDTQTPPWVPEPVATKEVPSSLIDARVSWPMVPTDCHFQSAFVVSA